MWSIAIKTLFADRGKFFTALVGVVFSIVLVNIQGGLFLGLIHKASLLVDHSQADIWVGHKKMHNVDFPRDIPRRWAYRIRTIPGVDSVAPYVIGFSDMTMPSGGFEGVVVVGVERSSLMGNAWNLQQGRPEDILKTDAIILDAGEDDRMENPQIDELREIGGRRARVAGKSYGIMGFSVTPYVFTTYERAINYLRKDPAACSYIMVKLVPGAEPHRVCQAIRHRIPEVEALTREQYSRISVDFWMTRTGLGISFGAATLLGLFVGLIIVGQTLYAMVLDRVSEFGTLRAIGANQGQIFAIILSQACVMAVMGSILGLAFVAYIIHLYSTPRAPILVPTWLALGSCGLVLLICLLSSVLPYLRIRNVDPLMVLQS
jgi:putative ABC transport system permease protein